MKTILSIAPPAPNEICILSSQQIKISLGGAAEQIHITIWLINSHDENLHDAYFEFYRSDIFLGHVYFYSNALDKSALSLFQLATNTAPTSMAEYSEYIKSVLLNACNINIDAIKQVIS